MAELTMKGKRIRFLTGYVDSLGNNNLPPASEDTLGNIYFLMNLNADGVENDTGTILCDCLSGYDSSGAPMVQRVIMGTGEVSGDNIWTLDENKQICVTIEEGK